ncbi:hypothetical protein RUND412_010020 [Rhizina undulata]
MSLKSDAFPSSTAFDDLSASLSSDAAKKDAIKRGNAVFAFTLKNSSGATESWYLDLKKTGAVGKGLAPEGVAKPDVELCLSDEDFKNLVDGKVAAQKLFMGGKLNIKGDVMKATKAEVVLKNSQKVKAKL